MKILRTAATVLFAGAALFIFAGTASAVVTIKPLEDRIVVQANEAEQTAAAHKSGTFDPYPVPPGDLAYAKVAKDTFEVNVVLSARDVLAVIEK